MRYMEVKVKHEVLGTKDDEHVLVPLATARLNEDDDTVLVHRLPAAGLRGAPRFGQKSISDDDDRVLLVFYELEPDRSSGESKDFFGNRRQGRENADYLLSRSSTEPRAGG